MTTDGSDLSDKTVLVTGATDGLGRVLAGELAARGACVLIHGRDPNRLRQTEAEIRHATGSDKIRTYRADFASLPAVRLLAGEIVAGEKRLDGLVNNAGIGSSVPGGGERMLSADGYELRLAVNYLAGYLLTRELLELLKASAPARIVSVSSAGQMPLDCDNLMLEHGYRGVRAYCQSKLAQILFTFQLAEELQGTGVTANCLHPATYMPTKIVASPLSTLQEGSAATMMLVADPGLEGVSGRYFNGTDESRADPQAYDQGARRRLVEISQALVASRPAAG